MATSAHQDFPELVRRAMKKLVNVFRIYDVYEARSSTVASYQHENEAELVEFKSILLDETWLDSIETVRPGYGANARSYFDEGHIGMALVMGEEIVSMSWHFENTTDRAVKLGYYLLPAGHTWFHAAWVSPKWRGKGLQRLLARDRARYVFQNSHLGDPVLEANIERSNISSSSNLTRIGFEKTDKLMVVRIPARPAISWRVRCKRKS